MGTVTGRAAPLHGGLALVCVAVILASAASGCSAILVWEGQTLCGNGTIDPGEECDDGNAQGGDGCSQQCRLETCDNGVVDVGEECDGSNLNGQTCLSLGYSGGALTCGAGCQYDRSQCATICGDRLVGTGETCDDGDVVAGDGCDPFCQVEPGYRCQGNPSVCVLICSDGTIDASEACDDGNTTAGDGCESDCQVTPGWACTGEPSVCAPLCGNGTLDAGEECDDGNAVDWDGCNSCTIAEFELAPSPSDDIPAVAVSPTGSAWALAKWEASVEVFFAPHNVANSFLIAGSDCSAAARPDIDLLDNGEAYVVWFDSCAGQMRFDHVSPTTSLDSMSIGNVSGAPGQSKGPWIGIAHDDGSYVVAWGQNTLDMRRLLLDGTMIWNQLSFPSGDRAAIDVAPNGDTAYAVTVPGGDGDLDGIHGGLISGADGSFLWMNPINQFATGSQRAPKVGAAPDGTAVITWTSPAQDGDVDGVYARRMQNDGTPLGAEFGVNTTTAGNQQESDIAVAADGSFVIVWSSPDSQSTGIWARGFDATGAPRGSEFPVNLRENGSQYWPRIAMADDGRYLVVWYDGTFGYMGQHFTANDVRAYWATW